MCYYPLMQAAGKTDFSTSTSRGITSHAFGLGYNSPLGGKQIFSTDTIIF